MISAAPKTLNRSEVILIVILILLVSIVITYYRTSDIQLKIAWGGYGPQTYTVEKLSPENYQKDFMPGTMAEHYDRTLIMRIFPIMAKYFGANPSTVIYPFMFFQTLLFLLSVAFVTHTLFQNKFVTIASVFIIPMSSIAGLNLARFGRGFASYLDFTLYYAYANTFRLFALGYFLRNKHIACFIFLAFSIYCHITMGLFGLAFMFGYLLLKPKTLIDKSFIQGLAVFFLMVIPYALYIVSNAEISVSGMTTEQWLKATRIFSFHWYPATMKLFTINAHLEFFPILLVCCLFFISLRYQPADNDKNQKILAGVVVCIFLGLCGIVFSDIYPVPILIKLSLQRSTALLTFFGVLYLIHYSVRKIEDGNIFIIFAALFTIYALTFSGYHTKGNVLAFSGPGVAVLPVLFLLFYDLKEGRLGNIVIHTNRNKKFILTFFYFPALIMILMICTIDVIALKYKAGTLFPIISHYYELLWPPLRHLNFFLGFDFLLPNGGFTTKGIHILFITCVAGILIITVRRTGARSIPKKIVPILGILFALLSLVSVERSKYILWHSRFAQVAKSYMDVQLWAKNNTPADSLFMPDPAHTYGWRDFSERSSFGNIREWGYSAIAYSPDKKLYLKGLSRMGEFGVDIDKVTDNDIKRHKSVPYYGVFLQDLRTRYYSMSQDRLLELANQYGINFFIMQNKYLTDPFLLPVVYKNENFTVVSAKGINQKTGIN